MALPVFDISMSEDDLDKIAKKAEAASSFLKAISHEGRLMILCHRTTGEKAVTELENLLSARQAAVSQQLARLRFEGFVSARRDGKAIYYSLADDRTKRVLEVVYDLFCGDEANT
jgi:DNA-binding transcriptional ArsR family regulator